MRSSTPRAQGPAAQYDSIVPGSETPHPEGRDASTTEQTT